MTGPESDAPGLARPELVRVLESAARLQEVVPDAVLVGGSAAALWANHRFSYDHDHVLQDLSDRFDAVLEAIEATDGWVTNRVTPGKIILGELGDIESGVRQLIRNRPLEVTEWSFRPDMCSEYRRQTRRCGSRVTSLSGVTKYGTTSTWWLFLIGMGSLTLQMCSGTLMPTTPISAAPNLRLLRPSSPGNSPTLGQLTLVRSASLAGTRAWMHAGRTGGTLPTSAAR